ncbi:MAG: histidine phosphatase family protein [Chitinophagales bacterium]|nr:histidine phosphatase family protein [Chitinophagales bacterium]
MRKLFLIRHGKSSWDNPKLSDKDRPLKKRGRRDGLIIAKVLKEMHIQPDLIVSSPANRAFSSAMIIADEIGYPQEKIEKNEDLYFSGINSIYEVIRDIDDKHSKVFIFGHNPDFTSFANQFSDDYIDNVPTTGVVGIEFNVNSWKKIDGDNGSLIMFEFPSRYR